MNGKFDEHPVMNYISLHESSDRQEFMERQFEHYGIQRRRAFLTPRYEEYRDSCSVSGRFVSSVNHHGTNIAFLRCVRRWLDSTDEEYGIFLEDDTSLETSDHWTFTWSEFVRSLPADWDVVQLIRLNDWSDGRSPELTCRPRNWDDWGATCMMRRGYAERLLGAYMVSDTEYNFDIAGTDLMPIVENLLFCGLGLCLNAPMFVECGLPSTYARGVEPVHETSREMYRELWRAKGSSTSLQDLYR